MIQTKPKPIEELQICDHLQKDELYALSTIYLSDFEYIRPVHPYSFQVIVLPFVPQDYFHHECIVFAKIFIDLPNDYPLKTQRFHFEIQGLSKNFTQDFVQLAQKACDQVIELYEKETEGQPIVFAVVEALRDWVLAKSNYFQELYDERNKKTDENPFYVAPMPTFATHTPVTIENFLNWKKKFDQEMFELKKKEKNYILQEEMLKKVSGKQYFEKKKKQGDVDGDNQIVEQIIADDDDIQELSEEDFQNMDGEEEEEEFVPLYEREQLE